MLNFFVSLKLRVICHKLNKYNFENSRVKSKYGKLNFVVSVSWMQCANLESNRTELEFTGQNKTKKLLSCEQDKTKEIKVKIKTLNSHQH